MNVWSRNEDISFNYPLLSRGLVDAYILNYEKNCMVIHTHFHQAKYFGIFFLQLIKKNMVCSKIWNTTCTGLLKSADPDQTASPEAV